MTTIRSLEALLALALLISVDYHLAVSASWFVLLLLSLLGAGIMVYITPRMPMSKRVRFMWGGNLIILSIRYWDYNSRKPVLRSLYGLSQGAAKDEVLEEMSDFELSGQGKGFVFGRMAEQRPDLNKRVEFMNFTHTREGWGNSDWGLVYFVDGRLSETQFSHD